MDMERLYDTVDGIKGYLKDLDGLNRLKKDRMKAGYDRKEGLKSFLVLGRWGTDGCGNFGDATLTDDRYKPLDIAAQLPSVLLMEDVYRYGVHSITTNGNNTVPPVRVHCRECGQKWSIENAHDSVLESDTFKIDLAPYVGRTFRDVEADLHAKEDGAYGLSPEIPLRNDRFINLTPHPTIEGHVLNGKGWMDLREAGRDYVIQSGDESYGWVRHYTHKRCFLLRRSRESREYYVDLVKEAGFPEPVTEETPNERCHEQCCMPWQICHFPFGDVKVGWRSSVLSIDWSGLKGSPDLLSLFDDVDATKWKHGVHAHGRPAAVDYLKRVKMFLDAGFRCNGAPDCPDVPTEFVLCEDGDVAPRCPRHTLGSSAKTVPLMDAIVRRVHSH